MCYGGTSSQRPLSWWTRCWWCFVRNHHRSRSYMCSTTPRCWTSGGGWWLSYPVVCVSVLDSMHNVTGWNLSLRLWWHIFEAGWALERGLPQLTTGCIQILESHGIQNSNFQGLESHGIRPSSWKSWKVMENLPRFWSVYMFSAFTYIIIVHCQTRFNLLFSIIMNCVTYSLLYENLDLFDIHSIKQSWKDLENGHKWSWKVLENAHKKILESHGKPLSMFCTHTVTRWSGFQCKLPSACVSNQLPVSF